MRTSPVGVAPISGVAVFFSFLLNPCKAMFHSRKNIIFVLLCYSSILRFDVFLMASLGPAIARVFNPPSPEQNGHHFANGIFRRIFLNEKSCILIIMALKLTFVPKDPFDNKPALFHIMAWRRIDDKTLSEPMLAQFTDAFLWYWGRWT